MPAPVRSVRAMPAVAVVTRVADAVASVVDAPAAAIVAIVVRVRTAMSVLTARRRVIDRRAVPRALRAVVLRRVRTHGPSSVRAAPSRVAKVAVQPRHVQLKAARVRGRTGPQRIAGQKAHRSPVIAVRPRMAAATTGRTTMAEMVAASSASRVRRATAAAKTAAEVPPGLRVVAIAAAQVAATSASAAVRVVAVATIAVPASADRSV